MPQELKEGTAYMLAGFGAAMVAHFSAQVVASRTLGPELYGLYGLVIYTAALISGFFDPGLSVAMATLTAEKSAEADAKGITSVVKGGINIELALTFLFAIICLIFNRLIADMFFSGIRYLVFFLAIILIIQGFCGMFLGAIIGLRELRFVAFVRFFQQVSLLLLIIILIKGLSLSLGSTLSVHTLSMSLALCLIIVFMKKCLRNNEINDNSIKARGYRYDEWKLNIEAILKVATPVSFAAIASSWLQSSGPAIMNYLSGNNPGEKLGFFIILLTLGKTADTIITTVSRSIFPYLVHWNVGGDHLKIRKYVNVMTVFVLAGYLLLTIGSFVAGRNVICYVFGTNYQNASKYLPVALLVFCAISLRNIYKISLYSLKKPGLFLIVNLVGVSVLFVVLIAGECFLHLKDYIYLILLAMGLANITVTLGSLFLFKTELKAYSEFDFIGS